MKDERIALALSGGGFRAAAFHAGVLRHLANEGLLEQVNQISTVSGGTLFTGAVFTLSGRRFPSSAEYLTSTFPSIRNLLTNGDLFSLRALGVRGALSKNIHILYKRAHVLSWLIRRRWKIDMRLADLPVSPSWHINTTCFETGKNWRFSRDYMGDWVFGRHFSPDVHLADAMAASAAVPYAIGAFSLPLPEEGWWQTDPGSKAPLRQIDRRHSTVRLWDGGAYENMGIEQLYKPVEGLQDCDILVCSDASAPLGPPTSMLAGLLKGRLASPRLFDIAGDQIRSLRSRMLMRSISHGHAKAFLLRLGVSARSFNSVAGSLPGLSDEECQRCLGYPTHLSRMSMADFDLLAEHGREVAFLTIAHTRPTQSVA